MKYNWTDMKDKLNEFEPKESLWDSISSSLDGPESPLDFHKVKEELSSHTPKVSLWDSISSQLEGSNTPLDFNNFKEDLSSFTPKDSLWDSISSKIDETNTPIDFNTLKDSLSQHTPDESLWQQISDELDAPKPVYGFAENKDQLTEYTPSNSVWDSIENGLEIDQTIEQLPTHEPPSNIWDSIEEDLDDIRGGISYVRIAITIGISMLLLIGAALMINQEPVAVETNIQETTIQFASNEDYQLEWSDDEDVRLIQEMCQDYMAVCKQPKFKELESELLELNDHKNELLELVNEFDEESSYGPILAKIEVQKTALMKEMIAMI